jgi:hypothetical protein
LAQASSRSVPAAEQNKIVEAARNEGKVILYATVAPGVDDRIVAAFNAANPGIRWTMDAQKKWYLNTPVGPNAAAWPESYVKNSQIMFLGINP